MARASALKPEAPPTRGIHSFQRDAIQLRGGPLVDNEHLPAIVLHNLIAFLSSVKEQAKPVPSRVLVSRHSQSQRYVRVTDAPTAQSVVQDILRPCRHMKH